MIAAKVPGNVLVFTYRKLDRFFHGVAERTFSGNITYSSSWPGLEDVNLQTDFYRYYRRAPLTAALSANDYDEIVDRSCVLRLLPRSQAERMVNAMYRVIDDLTDRSTPDYLLTVMVDNYMTDLLARVCARKGARLLMLVAGPIDNTVLLTAYGEFNKVRDPAAAEVEQAMASLIDDRARVTYQMTLRQYTAWRHMKMCATWWAKAAYFRTAGFVLRDPLNFRYLMGSLPRRDGQSNWSGYRGQRFFDHDWSARLDAAEKPALFIPLGYTPEATVSYWLRDRRYIDYDDFIIDACARLGDTYQMLVKEHWTAVGARRWQFYERLKARSNTIVVPPEVNSREVMGRVDRVLVGAGTAGIEAAMRGKRVVTLDQAYYHVDGHFLTLGAAERLRDLPDMLEAFPFAPATADNQRRIVTRLLEGTLQGHMLPDARIDTEANFDTTSESLKRYLTSGDGTGARLRDFGLTHDDAFAATQA